MSTLAFDLAHRILRPVRPPSTSVFHGKPVRVYLPPPPLTDGAPFAQDIHRDIRVMYSFFNIATWFLVVYVIVAVVVVVMFYLDSEYILDMDCFMVLMRTAFQLER